MNTKHRFAAFLAVVTLSLSAALAEPTPSATTSAEKGVPSMTGKIKLTPQEGQMTALAHVPILGNQMFALGIPETIGERNGMILNFPEVKIRWNPPEESGALSHRWVTEGRVDYSVRLVPGVDSIDVEMRIKNLSDRKWVNVFMFNCLNPIAAKKFQDWKLQRTYMSKGGKPFRMDGTTRINEGPQEFMRLLQFYLHEGYTPSRFVEGFRSTSPDKTDGPYIVTLSEDGDSYMAATSPEAVFLFDNLDRCCIHSAPLFGDIDPGQEKAVTARIYLAKGSLEDFLARFYRDFPADSAKAARAAKAGQAKPKSE